MFRKMRRSKQELPADEALRLLAERFAPDDSAGHRRRVVDSEWDNFCVLEFDIEHITGKEAKI